MDTQAHFNTSQQISVMGKVGSSASRGFQSHECNSAKPPGRLARKKGESRTEPGEEHPAREGTGEPPSLPYKGVGCRSTVLLPHPARSSWWVGQNLAFAALHTTVPWLHTEVSGSTLDEQGLAESGHSLPNIFTQANNLVVIQAPSNQKWALRNPNKRPANHQRPGLVINYFMVTTPHICVLNN